MGKILFVAIVNSISCYSQATITRYDLNFSFDFSEKKLFCKATLTITKGDTLNLLLYRLLTARSIRDINGHNMQFTQRVTAFSDWDKLQVNAIQVVPNNATQLIIEYDGYLAGYTETGMQYIKDRIEPSFTILRPDCFAYPEVGITNWSANGDQPHSQFDYKVTVTVPDSLTVVNGGKLIDRQNANGNTTYTYVNIKPAWRIDVVIGKYKTHTDKDFIIQYFPEDSSRIISTAAFVKKAFSTYETWFGEKPAHRYTIIEIPDHWGSQTDITSILQEASAIKDDKQLYKLYHEISHTWNLKSLDNNPCRLESEGLASFLQYLVMEKNQNMPGALDAAAERIFQRVKKQFEKDPGSATIPISEYGNQQLTDMSYSKGMLFFYLLYKKMVKKSL